MTATRRLGRWICRLGLVVALWPGAAMLASDIPRWLSKAAQLPTPGDAGDAPAVVLLDETVEEIDDRGRARTEQRYAVRILNRAGREKAVGYVSYFEKSDKVLESEAWIVRGGEQPKLAEPPKWVDFVAGGASTIFSESRMKTCQYTDVALPGDVFGYRTVVEGPMLFAQEMHQWELDVPSLANRFVMRVAPGWTVVALLKGTAEPSVARSPDGRTWTWELANRPYWPKEPWTAPRSRVEARAMMNLVPPAEGNAAGLPRIFRTWAELAAYQESLSVGQCDSTADLASTARKLTQGCSSDLGKIRALTEYVQGLRYVAIDRNLRFGFGYRPRKASEVFATGFGDCKDKSNLLCALLREVGIRSHMAVARWTDGGAEVYPEWPSPYQFNHAILGIEVPADLVLPTVVTTQQSGPLLFVDPTATDTVVGDLPWDLQGTNVCLLGAANEGLIALPKLPVEQEQLAERKVRLTMWSDGSVVGDCSIAGWGEMGRWWRHRIRSWTPKELRDWTTERLNRNLRGASLKNVVTADDRETGRCGLSIEFSGPGFAQMMSGGLAIVRLDLLSHDTIPAFAQPTRVTPLEIRPLVERDEVTLTLPTNFKIEELPAKVTVDSAYGTYERSYSMKDDRLVSERLVKLRRVVVPPTDYPAFRKFLSDLAKADRSAVVLRRGI